MSAIYNLESLVNALVYHDAKTWWDERVEAVTRIVEAVLTEPEEDKRKTIDTPLLAGGTVAEWEPF